MTKTTKLLGLLGAASLYALAAGPAAAEGPSFSANIGGTTDYVFRGFSQTAGQPTIQGGLDMTYNMFYVGVWASGLDFGKTATGSDVANAEVDLYAGIKHKLGPVDLDLGVIYYVYPTARDAGAELDYVEIKLGASTTFMEKLTVGATLFYSPEYTGKLGETYTIEGVASYSLPKIGVFAPSIGGLIGTTIFSDNSALDYVYWNAGLTLAVDKLTFDFRYWDTDIADVNCAGGLFGCDERFVFTAKFTY